VSISVFYGKRPNTRPALAPHTLVTQQSFIPPAHFVRGGQVHQLGPASAHDSFGFVFTCTQSQTP